MFAVLCVGRVGAPRNNCNFIFQQQFRSTQNAISIRSCSSSVCENASEKSFAISSYLINSCGLPSKTAISASKKLRSIKSAEKPDAVLKLLREYGFTDAHHIPKLVSKWPEVLTASPEKTLLPKLKFFHSIGVPLPVLAQKLSACPFVLRRSLENSIIPSYNDLKNLLGSDERVVRVFLRCPAGFNVSYNIPIFRERGVPESSITTVLMCQPSLFTLSKKKLSVHIDQAVAMGFDMSKGTFIHAVRMFASMSESTLKHKMEVYRRCGFTESDINVAFLRNPFCMSLSEKKITANMDFLVNSLGCKPADIAQCPQLLGLSLDKIKLRCLVARVLNEKGLKNMVSVITLLMLPENKFLNRYIVKYEKDIPDLLDIYLSRKVEPFHLKLISQS